MVTEPDETKNWRENIFLQMKITSKQAAKQMVALFVLKSLSFTKVIGERYIKGH
jgi:hypothetical protein